MMLEAARFQFERFRERCSERPHKRAKTYKVWQKDCAELSEALSVAAARAAPYFHPRLTSVRVQPGVDLVKQIDLRTLSNEQLAVFAQRVALALEATAEDAGDSD
jgi:hypothetical protein